MRENWCRPSGTCSIFPLYPGLTPWAKICRRSAAGFLRIPDHRPPRNLVLTHTLKPRFIFNGLRGPKGALFHGSTDKSEFFSKLFSRYVRGGQTPGAKAVRSWRNLTASLKRCPDTNHSSLRRQGSRHDSDATLSPRPRSALQSPPAFFLWFPARTTPPSRNRSPCTPQIRRTWLSSHTYRRWGGTTPRWL